MNMHPTTDASYVAEAESSFFAQVYRWMATGLFLTAVAAFFVLANPSILMAFYRNPILMIVLFVVEIGLVFWLSARIMVMSHGQAVGTFCVYSALNGIVLAPIFIVYTGASIVSTFAITAGTFMIFSVYGYVTKKDLTSIGALAFMGLIGFIIASIVNMFLRSPMLYWLITYGLIAVFLGLIAYDTQKLKEMHAAGFGSDEIRGKLAIMGALKLYLDFINLFILLLRIFGRRR